MLGFTQVSWDDLSGKEAQPWSMSKFWRELSVNEKSAAGLLGYTQTAWDNDSGSEPQPLSGVKRWAELTTCSDGEKSYCSFCVILTIRLTPDTMLFFSRFAHNYSGPTAR